MYLPRIQYITHPKEDFEDLSWVHRLSEGGVKWIQLRIKEEDLYKNHPEKHFLAHFHETADKLRAVTNALGIILTINDQMEVASFCYADGLHIGQEDSAPANIPADFILGGTANSFGEMKVYNPEKFTYFGVGPLRFTATKTSLKPVLGFEGYRSLLAEMKLNNYDQPVFAIGGINSGDVEELLECGVYGIALSSAIFDKGHSSEVIESFTKLVDYGIENR